MVAAMELINSDVIETAGFKEDAVREEFVFPLLVRLGYASSGESQILRSKILSHPFIRIGTTQRPVNIVPDYLLMVGGKSAWVLDAKAPRENITSGANVEQVYSYAFTQKCAQGFLLSVMEESLLFLKLRTKSLCYILECRNSRKTGKLYMTS